MAQGYKGEILSIGNRHGVVFGQKIYQSLDEINRKIDLAVILTPAWSIPDILDQCGRKGIKNAVIESGGFSELGKEGHRIEMACHAVLFGLGGVFVELLDDVAWRVAPVSHEEARRMMDSISSIEALKGFRGRVPSDLEAVEDLLVRLSQLLMDFPMIKEIDINPIMVFDRGKGAQALDARVILSDE